MEEENYCQRQYRRFTCDALVLPDAPDILLGAIPLEGMDLTVNPKRELVGVHEKAQINRIIYSCLTLSLPKRNSW